MTSTPVTTPTTTTKYNRTNLPTTAEQAFDFLYEILATVPPTYTYPAEHKRHMYNNPARPLTPVYFLEDGTPACIVGVGLAALGFTLDDVLAAGNGTQWVEVDELLPELGWPLTPEEQWEPDGVTVLNTAQGLQDHGYPWHDIPARIATTRKSLAEYVRPTTEPTNNTNTN